MRHGPRHPRRHRNPHRHNGPGPDPQNGPKGLRDPRQIPIPTTGPTQPVAGGSAPPTQAPSSRARTAEVRRRAHRGEHQYQLAHGPRRLRRRRHPLLAPGATGRCAPPQLPARRPADPGNADRPGTAPSATSPRSAPCSSTSRRDRLYYTLAGSKALYYRYFQPESNIVGSWRYRAADSATEVDRRPRNLPRRIAALLRRQPAGQMHSIEVARSRPDSRQVARRRQAPRSPSAADGPDPLTS